jgi:hypothetical protein
MRKKKRKEKEEEKKKGQKMPFTAEILESIYICYPTG